MSVITILDSFDKEVLEQSYEKNGFNHSYLLRKKDDIIELTKRLKEEEYFLETITAVDKKEKIRLIYIFNKMQKVHRVAVYLDIDYSEDVPSLIDFFKSADWFESEVYDFFGVKFTGNPNLKRLLTPEGMEGYPLLKSWKAEED
ncbi:MAG: NADH-quinone oxidoreductase subunit C [Proteobacteria bacterium]|nr:NADH-quinone oxidoreductase subunit C [Pseudomonadota bacterium]